MSLSPLRGAYSPPADKSLTHRYLFFAALTSDKVSTIFNPLISRDTRASIIAITQLGCKINQDGNSLVIRSPKFPITVKQNYDCLNSGTTARHLIALLASLNSQSLIQGDNSLSKRDMSRITTPLESFGAKFNQKKYLPISIVEGIKSMSEARLPIASAQVKSALLLASIFHPEKFHLLGELDSRDHTENFFKTQNGLFETTSNEIISSVKFPFQPFDFSVPGDPSSAAFIIAAAVLVPGSKIKCQNFLANKTRQGFILALQKAKIEIEIEYKTQFEPIGEFTVSHTPHFSGFNLSDIPLSYLIDEIPILSLMALFAQDTSTFTGLGELTHKESNRLLSILELHHSWGCVETRIENDSLIIKPIKKLKNISSYQTDDHRLAMTRAIGNYLQSGALEAVDPCVEISYPSFYQDLKNLIN